MIPIVGTRVNPVDYLFVVDAIVKWSLQRESRYICAANVHMLMEAYDSSEYKQIVNSADLIVPDGMPIVWLMRFKGQKMQQRIYGPALMLYILEAAAKKNIPIGLYGGKPEVLNILNTRIRQQYPRINIVYSFSPPFRGLSEREKYSIIHDIDKAGVRILFVGLGCPKQEIWMGENRGRIQTVMIGVGAAFDFHAGIKPQAPKWMQKIGLEWLFRLITEPRRLWWRYLYHNPRFTWLALLDLIEWKFSKHA